MSQTPVSPVPQTRAGGSFAPPLPLSRLAEYRSKASQASPAVAEVLLRLCDMVEHFYQTPASTLPGFTHPSGTGLIVPLEEAEKARIFDSVPWPHELKAYGELFDSIPADSQKPLRDAAFHLLWFACELDLDREPITNDKI